MSTFDDLNRRRFLRGLGTALALPALEATLSQAATAAGTEGIRRLAFVYSPNGFIMDKWTPEKFGTDFDLSPTLKPLQKVKGDIQIFTGLQHDKAWANGDGGGDHARANATFLTGRQARKTSGSDIHVGVSVDQMVARRVGGFNKLKSLELSCDRVRTSGSCDSGYSCAYQYNLAWADENTPVSPEVNPRQVFERMFEDRFAGLSDRERARKISRQRSVLDLAMQDAKTMARHLGRNDRNKLEEYLTCVRELEHRIQRAESISKSLPEGKKPEGIPDSYKEYLRLMYDLMVLAFQTNTTRVATFLTAHDGSNRNFRSIGVSDGHHGLSHHRNEQVKIQKIEKIDHFYLEQFAYFLEKLRSMEDGPGANLLDNSMIVFGSGISDANRHRHDDLPVILAGGGAGTLKPGRHVLQGERNGRKGTPMTNLYLSLMDRMQVKVDRFADSTGRLKDI